MTNLPPVIETVSTEVLGHLFCFRRLKWTDMAQVNKWMLTHKMDERLAITALALHSISGLPVSPNDALKALTTLPKAALFKLFKFYKGSLDLHRMFEAPSLYSAPDAVTYVKHLDEEAESEEKAGDELEEFLIQRFGRKEVEEEMEMAHQMATGSKFAGAVKLEQEYLASTVKRLNEEESW